MVGIIAMAKSHQQQMHLIPQQIRMLFCSHGHPYSGRREWRHEWRGSNSWLWKLSWEEMAKKINHPDLSWFVNNKEAKRLDVSQRNVITWQSWVGSLYSNRETSWLPVAGTWRMEVIWASSWQGHASLTMISKTPSGCRTPQTWKEWKKTAEYVSAQSHGGIYCRKWEKDSLYEGTFWCVLSE